MQSITQKDEDGREWIYLLPSGMSPEQYGSGAIQGPLIDTLKLGLPRDVAVRLHNELVARKLFTTADVRRRAGDVDAALRAAYRVDAITIINSYLAEEGNNGS